MKWVMSPICKMHNINKRRDILLNDLKSKAPDHLFAVMPIPKKAGLELMKIDKKIVDELRELDKQIYDLKIKHPFHF